MSVINTNITSMIGQQNLSKSQSSLQTSMERLSSGLRINSAKDDAAGQAIANRMTSQTSGLAQAQRNANDGISLAQTAEGSLNQVNDNLQRIRELTVQAQNGTNSASDIDSIQQEVNQRLEEIDRIATETDFNGSKILDTAAGDETYNIQVGANDGEQIVITIKDNTAWNLNENAQIDTTTQTVNGDNRTVSAEGFDVLDAADGTPLAKIDAALKAVDVQRSDLGAVQNRFESAITNLQTTETNLTAAKSRIEDADYASEVSDMTRSQILQQAGTSMLAQANQIPQNVLSLLG